MESIETKGRWFLPKRPDLQVTGTLRFDPISGGELEIAGDTLDPVLLELYGNKGVASSLSEKSGCPGKILK